MILRRGLVLSVMLAGALSMTLAAAACSSSTTGSSSGDPSSPAPGDDAGTAPADGGAAQEGGGASVDATSSACEGACKVTSLVVDIGGKKRTLTRAQFGTQQGSSGTELHTESHLGGQPACPQMNSPSPDYTLIVTSIPRGATGRALSDRDGVIGTLFDFKGDLGLPPFTKAVSVNLTVVGEDPATPPTWVALDVSAAFREGDVTGHLYAEYCTSLSE